MVPNRAKVGELDLNICGKCIKYVLVATNIVLLLMACAVIGIGVWILVDKIYIGYIFDSVLFKVSAWMIIIGAGLLFFVAFLGCCGALRENQDVLIVYFVALIPISFILMIGGILAIVFRNETGEESRIFMRKSLQEDYGIDMDKQYNREVTHAWDNLQRQLYCCAVEDQGWSTYRSSWWFNDQPGFRGQDGVVRRLYVPASCCMRDHNDDIMDQDRCQSWMDGPPVRHGGNNEALHYRGCYHAGKDLVEDYTSVLCAIGIGVALILIAAIMFSIVLYQLIEEQLYVAL